MKDKNYNLILGDCITKNEQIKSGSVDLILTDLPYGNMKRSIERSTFIEGGCNRINEPNLSQHYHSYNRNSR